MIGFMVCYFFRLTLSVLYTCLCHGLREEVQSADCCIVQLMCPCSHMLHVLYTEQGKPGTIASIESQNMYADYMTENRLNVVVPQPVPVLSL